MAEKKQVSIIEEENRINDHFLDLVGAQFQFDHEKGLSEWIKNCADAYIRKGLPDDRQYVILRFTDGQNNGATIECIDFVGMDSNDITDAFRWWGDPDAAKRGLHKSVYGGHGNGGKYYMRQMFDQSYFITYKNGKLCVYGFSPSRHYGFAQGPKGIPMKDISYTPEQALKFAGINKIVPTEVVNQIVSGETGFTVVRGIGPAMMKNIVKANRVAEKLINHPQAHRVLSKIPVSVIYNNAVLYERLIPETVAPKPGFEKDVVIDIPHTLVYERDAEKVNVEMDNKEYHSGKLTLRTSEIALEKNSKYGELNRIDFMASMGVVASYKLYELGTNNLTQTAFIYGECECPILEEKNNSSVSNDRHHLIDTPRSIALRRWIAAQIDDLADKMSEHERKTFEEKDKSFSSAFNEILNKWKNRFLDELMSEILSGPGQGPGAGMGVGGSSGGAGYVKAGTGGTKSLGQGDKQGGGDTPRKGHKFPVVKLSSIDDDPLNPGAKLNLDPRHPLVYQRPMDYDQGIYWINTSSPLASAIIAKCTSESVRWRDYLLQRYIDIFVRHALHQLAKRDPDRFTADAIDADIFGTLVVKVHEAAAKDLDKFLFDDSYRPDIEQ